MQSRPSPSDRLALRLPELIALWRELAASDRPASSRPVSPLRRPELEVISAALVRLQRGLTGERELAGSAYMDQESALGAYLLYYWPVSYMETALLLEEILSGESELPKRVLDLGCGPGPMASALADLGASELTLVDGSARALALADRLAGRRHGPPPHPTTRVLVQDLALDFDIPRGPYDLVVAGHLLNELWKDHADRLERRHGLLRSAISTLSPGGLLLVVEPATLQACRETLELHDLLVRDGLEIVAPCPGTYLCPILAAGATRSCHLDTSWDPPEPLASLAGLAGLDRQSVKCSWFAVRTPLRSAGDSPDPETVARSPGSVSGASRGQVHNARLVSDPMLNKAGRVRYILCEGGRLLTLSAPTGDNDAARQGFFSLRRGDHIDVADPEPRTGGLGMGAASRLRLRRAVPLPGGPHDAP